MNAGPPTAQTGDPADLMDRIYRFQRFFYDQTRWIFLPGRNWVLRRVLAPAGARIMEIGCGTGRNLKILARRNPQARFIGLDASAMMLATAKANLGALIRANVSLVQAPAQGLDQPETLGLDRPLDGIICSYVLSMIPQWNRVLTDALQLMRPGGVLYLADFGDLASWPEALRRPVLTWLSLFHVQPRSDLLEFLRQKKENGLARVELQPIWGRYAFAAWARIEDPGAGLGL